MSHHINILIWWWKRHISWWDYQEVWFGGIIFHKESIYRLIPRHAFSFFIHIIITVELRDSSLKFKQNSSRYATLHWKIKNIGWHGFLYTGSFSPGMPVSVIPLLCTVQLIVWYLKMDNITRNSTWFVESSKRCCRIFLRQTSDPEVSCCWLSNFSRNSNRSNVFLIKNISN